MTTTLFDSHAGDGEALAANGGTSLDLPTSKTTSPRQGHPLKKVEKYGRVNKKGGVGPPTGCGVGCVVGGQGLRQVVGIRATVTEPAANQQRDGQRARAPGEPGDAHQGNDLPPSRARLPPI
jgi:hypothetical protein